MDVQRNTHTQRHIQKHTDTHTDTNTHRHTQTLKHTKLTFKVIKISYRGF